MDWHPFTLTTVTPAFLGQDPPGASFADPVPFAVSSLRGALRYWLRALIGAYVGEARGQLATFDAKVFGTAPGGAIKGGPSPIRLRARDRVPYQPGGPAPDWAVDAGYLLGQGLYDADNDVLRRRYIGAGTSVTCEVASRGGADCDALFLAALWALATFGGLGARARRGFGTVKIEPPAGLAAQVPGGWFSGVAADAALDDVLTTVGGAIQGLAPVPAEPRASAPPAPARGHLGPYRG